MVIRIVQRYGALHRKAARSAVLPLRIDLMAVISAAQVIHRSYRCISPPPSSLSRVMPGREPFFALLTLLLKQSFPIYSIPLAILRKIFFRVDLISPALFRSFFSGLAHIVCGLVRDYIQRTGRDSLLSARQYDRACMVPR